VAAIRDVVGVVVMSRVRRLLGVIGADILLGVFRHLSERCDKDLERGPAAIVRHPAHDDSSHK